MLHDTCKKRPRAKPAQDFTKNGNSILNVAAEVLTPQQYSVIEKLSKGKIYQQISQETELGISTIKKHGDSAKEKLDENNISIKS